MKKYLLFQKYILQLILQKKNILKNVIGTFLVSFTAQKSNEIRRTEVDVFVTVYLPGTGIIVFDPPLFPKPIREDITINTQVKLVSARGASNIQYSIVGGNTNNAFRIGSNNGQILVQKALDRETQSKSTLVIRAEASNVATEANFIISVTDVNDNSPRITFMEAEPKNIAVEDFSPPGSPVIRVNGLVCMTDRAGRY